MTAEIFAAMNELAGRNWTPVDLCGFELRASMLLLTEAQPLTRADNDFWYEKCRALLLRPALEPVASSYWHRFDEFILEDDSALKLASTLAGKRLVYRKGEAYGRSTDGDVVFEPLHRANSWLDRLKDAMLEDRLASAMPMVSYAIVIMAHPFSDSNGRFGRLMTHAALSRCTGIKLPVLPLAPAFYRHGRRIGVALDELSNTGNWEPYFDVFCDMLKDALQIAMLTLRVQPRDSATMLPVGINKL